MGKTAVLAVVTLIDYFCLAVIAVGLVQVCGAKLSLVLVRMVKLLDPVVAALAGVSLRAKLTIIDILTDLRLVGTQRPPPVLVRVMVVRALLVVVSLRIQRADLQFECGQVKKEHTLVLAEL